MSSVTVCNSGLYIKTVKCTEDLISFSDACFFDYRALREKKLIAINMCKSSVWKRSFNWVRRQSVAGLKTSTFIHWSWSWTRSSDVTSSAILFTLTCFMAWKIGSVPWLTYISGWRTGEWRLNDWFNSHTISLTPYHIISMAYKYGACVRGILLYFS